MMRRLRLAWRIARGFIRAWPVIREVPRGSMPTSRQLDEIARRACGGQDPWEPILREHFKQGFAISLEKEMKRHD